MGMASDGNKSQELIQQLLLAEKQAEELIATAKRNRLTKLRQAKDKAEEELVDFRDREEAKFQKDMGAVTKMEYETVQRDYATNKDKTVAYVTSKVLDVPLGLTDTQKQALRPGKA